jgi:hypothetical protein
MAVADEAGLDHLAFAGGDGNGRGARVVLAGSSIDVAVRVVAELA